MSDAALHVCMDTESPNIPQLRVSYRLSVRGVQCNSNVDNNKFDATCAVLQLLIIITNVPMTTFTLQLDW